MKYNFKLVLCLVCILALCFTMGVISFGCNECQFMDHRRIITNQTDVTIAGYATTWYVSDNHSLVHIGGTYAWANSKTDYNYGGQRSTTAIISEYGTIIGSHYESGDRAGCNCESVWQ